MRASSITNNSRSLQEICLFRLISNKNKSLDYVVNHIPYDSKAFKTFIFFYDFETYKALTNVNEADIYYDDSMLEKLKKMPLDKLCALDFFEHQPFCRMIIDLKAIERIPEKWLNPSLIDYLFAGAQTLPQQLRFAPWAIMYPHIACRHTIFGQVLAEHVTFDNILAFLLHVVKDCNFLYWRSGVLNAAKQVIEDNFDALEVQLKATEKSENLYRMCHNVNVDVSRISAQADLYYFKNGWIENVHLYDRKENCKTVLRYVDFCDLPSSIRCLRTMCEFGIFDDNVENYQHVLCDEWPEHWVWYVIEHAHNTYEAWSQIMQHVKKEDFTDDFWDKFYWYIIRDCRNPAIYSNVFDALPSDDHKRYCLLNMHHKQNVPLCTIPKHLFTQESAINMIANVCELYYSELPEHLKSLRPIVTLFLKKNIEAFERKFGVEQSVENIKIWLDTHSKSSSYDRNECMKQCIESLDFVYVDPDVYTKIKMIAQTFPKLADIVPLPSIELTAQFCLANQEFLCNLVKYRERTNFERANLLATKCVQNHFLIYLFAKVCFCAQKSFYFGCQDPNLEWVLNNNWTDNLHDIIANQHDMVKLFLMITKSEIIEC